MGRFVVTCIALQELLIDDPSSDEAAELIEHEDLPCAGSFEPYFYCVSCAYADEREEDEDGWLRD